MRRSFGQAGIGALRARSAPHGSILVNDAGAARAALDDDSREREGERAD